ncbi:MAG: alanine--glyoxylate aminotransferase family protein [Chthonomonadales bacterium]|nr:alanine--glyoxylate aminotransferase family protein [Chthonomonadales bacterium]
MVTAQPLPTPRVLLGPGPSAVATSVLEALGRAPVGYLDPELFEALADIQAGLRTLFGTANPFTLALTGTGMAAMESCFANLLEPGDAAVIGVNGFFGERMAEIAARYGARVTCVDAPWGEPLDPERLDRAAAAAGTPRIVACVHAETSTGVRQPLEPVARVARAHGALLVVDAVTSLGGLPVQVDEIGIDACYSASQKCMGCPAGLAPISVSERAWRVVEGRRTKVTCWYYDWQLLRRYWSAEHAYHHTVPGNLLAALREALRRMREEGLPERYGRHQAVSDRLLEGLAALDIHPFAREGYRLPTLNAMALPEGLDDAAVRRRLLVDYGIEIGGGLGELKGRVWRIGTMGESATPRNVEMLLGALGRVLA